MENNKTNELHEEPEQTSGERTKRKIGRIVRNKIPLCKLIGECEVLDTETGITHWFQVAIGAVTSAPIVLGSNGFFEIPWKDIVNAAMIKGLSNPIQEANKNETN